MNKQVNPIVVVIVIALVVIGAGLFLWKKTDRTMTKSEAHGKGFDIDLSKLQTPPADSGK